MQGKNINYCFVNFYQSFSGKTCFAQFESKILPPKWVNLTFLINQTLPSELLSKLYQIEFLTEPKKIKALDGKICKQLKKLFEAKILSFIQ